MLSNVPRVSTYQFLKACAIIISRQLFILSEMSIILLGIWCKAEFGVGCILEAYYKWLVIRDKILSLILHAGCLENF